MYRLLVFAPGLMIVHIAFKAFWAYWVPLLTDPKPIFFTITTGEVFAGINRVLIAPIAQSWLDLSSHSPLWPSQAVACARWLIGG